MFNDYPDILTLSDICEILRIGKNKASYLLNSGQIKAFQIGGHWKVSKQNLMDYIVENSALRQKKS